MAAIISGTIFLIAFVFFLILIYFKIVREIRINQKLFKLYEIRDRISKFVIIGKLTKDDTVFTLLYPMIVSTITHSKHFKLSVLLKGESKNDEEINKHIREFFRDLKTKDDEVKKLVQDYFMVTAELFIQNSWIFALMVKIIELLMSFQGEKKLKIVLEKVKPQPYYNGIKVYQHYNKYAALAF